MQKELFIANSNRYWFSDDGLHREGGPAAEWDDGGKEWWVGDEYRRKGGPAWERPDENGGTEKWR